MQEDSDEHDQAERRPHQEGAGDRDAVEERMQQQADERRRARQPVHRVRLLTEVKVRRERVLGEVHGEITGQHEGRRGAPRARERLRKQLHDRHGQHEARTEGDEVLDDGEAARRPPRHRERADQVPERRDERVHQSPRHGTAGMLSCCAAGLPTPRRAGVAAPRPRRGRPGPRPRSGRSRRPPGPGA